MINTQVVLFDGFDLQDAISPYEVLCAAELINGRRSVRRLTVHE